MNPSFATRSVVSSVLSAVIFTAVGQLSATTFRADEFIESVGVNLEVQDGGDASLAYSSIIRPRLLESGIRHARLSGDRSGLDELLEFRSALTDNYGARIRGWIVAPVTGNYVFWVIGDDAAELWLSTNSSTTSKQKIAWTTSATGWTQWNKSDTQKSSNNGFTLALTAGNKYFIEVLHKDATGGDHLRVGWSPPGTSTTEPSSVIPLDRFIAHSRGVNGATGLLEREVWLNVPGNTVASIPQGTTPNLVDKDLVSKLRDLNQSGNVRFNFINSPPNVSSHPISTRLNFYVRNRSLVASVEGPNEYDHYHPGDNNWATTLRNYQQELYQTIKGHAQTASIPVLAPSFVDHNNMAAVGSLNACADYGNMHNYTRHPENTGWGSQFYGHGYGSLGFNIGAVNTHITTKPVISTETGYSTHTTGMPESVAGKYISRLLLHSFLNGIPRTYVFRFWSGTTDYDTGAHVNFRILDHDGTPQPAFNVVRNLITLLEDTSSNASSFQPGSLLYNITGSTANLEKMVIQKGDGRFYLALWLGKSNWNHDTKQIIDVPAQSIAVNFQTPLLQTRRFHPWQSTNAQATGTSQSLNLNITDNVVLIEVTPAQGGGFQTGLPPVGAMIGFAADNNKFITADLGQNGTLIANRDAIGTWEEFEVVAASSGRIALRALINDRYVCAESGGNASLIANRTGVGNWEQFTLESATGGFRLRANANGNLVARQSDNRLLANATTGTASTLFRWQFASGAAPDDWISQDIGNTSPAGSVTLSPDGNSFTVRGAGADIYHNADAFHFVHQTLTGDGTITARVSSLQNTNTWAKAGVMIRETIQAGSKHAMTVVSPSGGVAFQRRSTTNGSTVGTTNVGISAPHWVRIVRQGNTFTSFRSSNGSTWTQIGTAQTITMNAQVHVGLAVTSHNNGTLCEAVFDNVLVVGEENWINQDIGNTSPAGSASLSGDIFSVRGSGADIYGNADAFHFVHQSLTGNGSITARVDSVQNTNTWAKAGVMIRESTAASSKHAMVIMNPGASVSLQRRTTTAGASASTTLDGNSFPHWVRLTRNGDTLTGFQSSNGTNWTQIGSISIPMSQQVLIGLAVTSHNSGTLCEAVYSNVTISTQ